MLLQDKRGTAYPIFIVVEDKKIYGMDSDFSEDKERKDFDTINRSDFCKECQKLWDEGEELPEKCEDWDCLDSFINFKIEKNVPNMRAGFFFTANACNEHIEQNRHHYGKEAHSYAISAYHNDELKAVMVELIGEVNQHKLR